MALSALPAAATTGDVGSVENGLPARINAPVCGSRPPCGVSIRPVVGSILPVTGAGNLRLEMKPCDVDVSGADCCGGAAVAGGGAVVGAGEADAPGAAELAGGDNLRLFTKSDELNPCAAAGCAPGGGGRFKPLTKLTLPLMSPFEAVAKAGSPPKN